MAQNLNAWKALRAHAGSDKIQSVHLRDLLADQTRTASLCAEYDGVLLDYSRQRVTDETMNLLFDLAHEAGLKSKIDKMFAGEHINVTEDRAVMHVALRADKSDTYIVDGEDVVPQVIQVRDKIKAFAEAVRSGHFRGHTGKPLVNVVAIGIGGSFLGAQFVHEALRSDTTSTPDGGASAAAKGRTLRFLANVDPVDVSRAIVGLDPEETLVVVISKTFTTSETMLNARTLRQWIVSKLGPDAVSKHMVACSTAVDKVKAFGINESNIFPFWDWVGGRYSVTSAVGLVPLSLQYGWSFMESFLAGCRSIDKHFVKAEFKSNLPVLLGLLGIWNSSFLGLPCRAIAPYSQALVDFANHIQQVDMESNGKAVDINGEPLAFQAGEIDFGQPGTNGQHSFYQLFHQGRVVPVDFIGFANSQFNVEMKGEPVSNHDELMSNFFAQPDALAVGQSFAELTSKGVPPTLAKHKAMPGNRPSNVILLPKLGAYEAGQLLALYEHRTAVQGFIWNLNSFDQFGVELGKVLAVSVRNVLKDSRGKLANGIADSELDQAIRSLPFNVSTQRLLARYLKMSKIPAPSQL